MAKPTLKILPALALALGLAGLVVCLYLGFPVNGGSPNWQTGVFRLPLVAAIQWVLFFAFRRRINPQSFETKSWLFGGNRC